MYMRSLAGSAIEFHSCFISYSTKGQEFGYCRNLRRATLVAAGVWQRIAPYLRVFVGVVMDSYVIRCTGMKLPEPRPRHDLVPIQIDLEV